MNHRIQLPLSLEKVVGESRNSRGALLKTAALSGIALLFGSIAVAVYLGGGTHTAYLHLLYLPILLGALVFGIAGGITSALVAGFIVVGPFMPMDVNAGTPQPHPSWLFRATFFLVFGIAAGAVIGRLTAQLKHIRNASLLHAPSGLPTHLTLEQVLRHTLRHRKQQARYVLIIIAVKNYDQIFNTLGFEITDPLALKMADRLRPLFPQFSQIYRLDASQLALLAPLEEDSPAELAARTIHLLSQPVQVGAIPVYLDVVAGAAICSGTDDNAAAALQRANTALTSAREHNRSFVAYESMRIGPRKESVRLLGEVQHAIADNQFELVYQPQLDLSSGRMVGVEALIRWQHPAEGQLSPGRFMPLLEDTALINDITRWVVQTAVPQAAQWQRQGLDISLAINVSPRNLSDLELLQLILDEIDHHGLEKSRIEIEITESAVMEDAEQVGQRLKHLKATNVTVSLDDFGSGYTSIQHLTALPIDKLKLDRSLIHQVTEDARRMHIVESLIRLASDLNMKTVGEGVEDVETARFLRQAGCDIAQGYYFSKPVRPAEIV